MRHMLVIICATYGKNSSRIVCVVERKWQDGPYFSSFIAKSWLNDLKDMGQGHRSLYVTHLLMLVIICVYHGKNPTRNVGFTEQDGRMDGWSETNIPPTTSLCGGIKRILIWNYNMPILTSLLNRNSDTKSKSHFKIKQETCQPIHPRFSFKLFSIATIACMWRLPKQGEHWTETTTTTTTNR